MLLYFVFKILSISGRADSCIWLPFFTSWCTCAISVLFIFYFFSLFLIFSNSFSYFLWHFYWNSFVLFLFDFLNFLYYDFFFTNFLLKFLILWLVIEMLLFCSFSYFLFKFGKFYFLRLNFYWNSNFLLPMTFSNSFSYFLWRPSGSLYCARHPGTNNYFITLRQQTLESAPFYIILLLGMSFNLRQTDARVWSPGCDCTYFHPGIR